MASASTKGGSQRQEFGWWIGLDWQATAQLLVSASTQGGSQRQEFGWWIGLDWQSCCATLGQRFHTGWESAPGVWIIGTALVFACVYALLADGALSPRTQGVFSHLF